ncbi:M1 family aminopeptidase [Clostridium oryzae]|uniref:Peptidase family M1 n=1 Tax=Clostridium oryzae TaxID=1450648 RepID=A0A1V4IX50_9CLOT|nr:M1 family aminopeptidase [Clostridium oryzae]OPJ64628.1 peptidase family M1 [Clostridium oryzae]
MNLFALIINENKKFARSTATYVMFLLTIVTPLWGFYSKDVYDKSKIDLIILAPAKGGAIICAVIWTFFTIHELDRNYRCNITCIIETNVSMLKLNAAKVFAVTIAAGISISVTSIIYLPYSIYAMGKLFNLSLYLFSYFVIMLPGVCFSILISAGIYMIVKRRDLSLLLYGVLFYISYNTIDKYLASWIQTDIGVYSVCFGNAWAVRTALWNRLVWFLISMTVFIVGILCTRRYDKNVLRSLQINLKNLYLPCLAVILVIMSFYTYVYEPYFDEPKNILQKFIDDKKVKMSTVADAYNEAIKQNNKIIVKRTKANIVINTKAAELQGKALYYIQNKIKAKQEISVCIQPGYKVKVLKINGKKATYSDKSEVIENNRFLKLMLPPDKHCIIQLEYGGKVLGDHTTDILSATTISNEYICLAGDELIPRINANRDENEFSGKLTLPSDLVPVTTGDETKETAKNEKEHTNTWSFHCAGEKVGLYAGDYALKKIRAGGINVEFYYNRAQTANVKKTKAVHVIKAAIKYYTGMFGKLNFTNKPLKIVELHAALFGGFANSNISTCSEDVFNPITSESDNDEGTNNEEVLAHEICHQWWGDSVLFPYSGEWSSEGLTVYSTYRFLQHEHGRRYAQKIGIEQWRKENSKMERSFYYRHPQYLNIMPQEYSEEIISANNMTSMYKKIPLEIYKAQQLIGKRKFDKILAKLYRKYKLNLSFHDFLKECRLRKEMISVD